MLGVDGWKERLSVKETHNGCILRNFIALQGYRSIPVAQLNRFVRVSIPSHVTQKKLEL